MTTGTVTVTRRVLIDADDGGLRVVDTFRNPTAAEQPLNVQLSQHDQLPRPAEPDRARPQERSPRNLAWVAGVPVGSGKAAVDVYAGPGAKQGARRSTPSRATTPARPRSS